MSSKARPATSSPALRGMSEAPPGWRKPSGATGPWKTKTTGNATTAFGKKTPRDRARKPAEAKSSPCSEEPSFGFTTRRPSRLSTAASTTIPPNPTPPCASSKLPRHKSTNQTIALQRPVVGRNDHLQSMATLQLLRRLSHPRAKLCLHASRSGTSVSSDFHRIKNRNPL